MLLNLYFLRFLIVGTLPIQPLPRVSFRPKKFRNFIFWHFGSWGTTSPLCLKALQWPYQPQMEFENEWWLRKCAKVVLKHNFLLQNGKIFQYSGEAHFLVKRHGCCFIFAKSKNWNLWALTHQPLVQMLSNFVCVTIMSLLPQD